MPRNKRKRDAETPPPPASRRRSGEREGTGAEPVGKTGTRDDSEDPSLDTSTSAAQDNGPADSKPKNSNNNPESKDNAEKEEIETAKTATGDEGNDQADSPNETATAPQHANVDGESAAGTMDNGVATSLTSGTVGSETGEKQNDSTAGGEISQERIQAVLEHRKLLLKRLQQGRAVVRNRLEEIYKKDPSAKGQTEEQEIVAFQMLAKEATSLARKNKAETEAPPEKRTSVSLRKGSSVGKKMNAALSSLAPGMASAAAAAAAAASGTPLAPPPPVPKAAPPAALKSSSVIPPSSQPIPQASAPAPAPAAAPKKGSTTSKMSSKSTSRPTAAAPRTTAPLGVPAPFSHTNLLGTPSRVAQTLANVPECLALREKRRSIRNKLAEIVLPDTEQSAKSRRSADALRRATQSLPPRRKTQWDYLLDEMRWMATDFKQEREWKVKASGSLCREVRKRNEIIPIGKQSSGTTASDGNAAGNDTKANKADESTAMEIDEEEPGTEVMDIRSVAKKVSGMVEDFVNQTSNFADSDETRAAADEPPPAMENEPRDSSNPDELPSSIDKGKGRDQLYNLVSDIASKAAKSSRLPRVTHCKVNGTEIQLSSEQSKAMLLLEDKLAATKSGAILEGSYASGKTILALALLSRTNGDGPHLVLCPSTSLIKWVDRSQYFDAMQVRSVQYVLAAESALGDNDIVLCDHVGLEKLRKEELLKFRSVVVDCRHPFGYGGSRWAVDTKGPNESPSLLAKVCPKEVISGPWWARLVSSLQSDCSRRIIIENKTTDVLSKMLVHLSEKERLELIAWRIGFLTSLWKQVNERMKLPKLLVGWARKRIKGKKMEGSKYDKVVSELLSFLDSHVCSVSAPETVDEAPSDFTFDIEKCEMTQLQRQSYEDLCNESRRVLSTSFEKDEIPPDRLEEIAQCLFKMRRSCLHYDLEGLFHNPLVQSTSFTALSGRSRKDSSSQSNQELAARIMEGSGKMSRLASFLSSECSVTLPKETQNLVWRKDGKRKSAKVKHSPLKSKVVVLSCSPEAQLLTSLFLNSLGIEHEFVSDEFEPGGDCTEWIRGQGHLTRFNHQNVGETSATKVVVCSPLAIAGDHGGVGVDTADVVLCIDEDWSGRNELVFNALLHRFWCALNKKCKFIKLVSAETCEENFLADGDFGQLDRKDLLWKSDALGLFSAGQSSVAEEAKTLASMLETRDKPEAWCGFPGLSIYSMTNEPLADVLSTSSPLKRIFGTTEPMLFLPAEDERSRIAFAQVAVMLVKAEGLGLPMDVRNRSLHAMASVPSGTMRLDLGRLPSSFFPFQAYTSLVQENDPNKEISLGNPVLDQAAEEDGLTSGAAVVDSEVPGMREDASSHLFYDAISDEKPIEAGRPNAFVSSFTSYTPRQRLHATEALTYFPPLFPRMLEASILAQNSVSGTDNSNDRQQHDSKETAESSLKRPISTVEGAESENKASDKEARSILSDLSDDYGLVGVGAVPLTQDSILAAALEQKEPPLSDYEKKPDDSMVLIVSRKRQRPAHPVVPPSSLAVSFGDSRTLSLSSLPRVTNVVNANTIAGKSTGKQGPAGPQLQRSANGPIPAAQQPVQLGPQGIRLKESIRARFLATSRQSGVGTSIFENPSFRAAFARIHSRLRKSTTRDCWHSSMIIDAGPGLPIQACKKGGTSTVQEIPDDRQFFTSIVKRIDSSDSATGNEAVLAANVQKAALRRSLTAPSRVDFGPFQSGFLASPSGMTSIVPPRPRGGVSLPMGVKVPPPTRGRHAEWTKDEEDLLTKGVLRFGSNWLLAARIVSGVQDVETPSTESLVVHQQPRSGRSCREHWHVMARSDPSLASDLRQSERLQREKASRRFGASDSSSSETRRLFERKTASEDDLTSGVASQKFIVPVKSKDEEMNVGEPSAGEGSGVGSSAEKKTRSFSAMAAARAKVVRRPRSIPGVQNGTPPTISPSHSSHMQAIQKSPTAQWFGGRTDLWPIQFLDAADRHRKMSPAVPPVPPQARVPSVASRSHGVPPGGRPPYPPPPHRMGAAGPRPVVPPSAARTSSATVFAPPASRGRPGEDAKPAPS